MKIAVRGTNWIGDAVMQIPALREIRRIFSGAHVTLVTRSWAQGIFADADFIDEILPFETSDSAFKQAKMWRDRKFDAAILFTNSFESALVARLGNAKKRFGYRTDGRSFLLTDDFAVPVWKNARHEVFYYLNLVGEVEKFFFGASKISFGEPKFELKVSEKRKDAAREILEKNGADLSKKIVVFCPGATNSRAKRWRAESYAKLNDKFQNESGANVVLIGDKSELEASKKVAEKSERKPIILTGKTALSELVAVLSAGDLLVSNDTGPAHVAAALGTKTVVIFGPTNPLTTHPPGAEIIRRDVACSPCMLRDCPIDHRCMTLISAEEVFQKASNFL